jgi:hypothetical protein
MLRNIVSEIPAGWPLHSTSRMPQTLVESGLFPRGMSSCLPIAQMDLEVQILLLNLLH